VNTNCICAKSAEVCGFCLAWFLICNCNCFSFCKAYPPIQTAQKEGWLISHIAKNILKETVNAVINVRKIYTISHYRFSYSSKVLRGVDVSLRCEVSFLSESSTLQWERDGEQTSNTTLLYNNSAYIILHTVDEHNQGKYYCRLMEDGRVTTVRIHTLYVSSSKYILY